VYAVIGNRMVVIHKKKYQLHTQHQLNHTSTLLLTALIEGN
jgi:hypothetical protein